MIDVRVLGTGSADGWPNPFCACGSCTSERAAGRIRGQSAALVDDTMLLDCGPETPRAAERAGVDLTGLRHVLITHRHPDHCSPAFLLFRSWIGDAPLDVVGPPEVIDACRMWVAPDTSVNFVTVTPGQRIMVGDFDVRVLPAHHDRSGTAVLYDVTGPGGRLLYATDTGPLPDATVTAVWGAAFDVVLMEETFGDFVTHGTDHLDLATFPDQVRRLREAGAITDDTDLVAVHLSHHNPPTVELSRRLSAWGARVVDDGTLLASSESAARTATPCHVLRTLVIGGARSGKSREAERLLATGDDVTYVASSHPNSEDPDWVERIRLHRAHRPAHWHTVETLDLVGLLGSAGGPLLIDCLTLWLARVMDDHDAWDREAWRASGEKAVAEQIDALVAAWRRTRRRVVAVTNEVGQGVVPGTDAGVRFRDLMGRLNASLAAETEDVRLCVAGRVTVL